jgi:hypothetical protein
MALWTTAMVAATMQRPMPSGTPLQGPGDGPIDERRVSATAGSVLDGSAVDLLGLDDGRNRLERELGRDAARRFEDELTAFQRRRSIAYCLLVLALLVPITIVDVLVAFVIETGEPTVLLDYADPVFDLFLVVVYTVFLVQFLRTSGPRERIMSLLRRLLVIVCSAIVLGALTLWTEASRTDPTTTPGEAVFIAGATAITTVLILHLLASVYVALSPRDAIMPMIPITLVYVVGLMAIVQGPMRVKFVLLASWVFAAAPGILWSTWRYRRFLEEFRWKSLHAQLGDIRSDLAEARRVHEQLFPSPIREGAVRCNYAYEPMRDIGGDYLFLKRRGDGSVLAVLVDVAGHGVASALAANRIHGELERIVESRPDLGPGRAIAALNRYLHRTLSESAVFASAVAIECLPEQGLVRWASAGHPAALVLRGDGTFAGMAATATLLGVLDEHVFEAGESELPFGPADVVVACTDGVHEAAGAGGEFFGEERFRDQALSALVGGPDRIAPAVLDAVRRWRGGDPSDDVLVVAAWSASGR